MAGRYPGLVPSSDPGACVVGEVWLLYQADDAFSLLDDYEDCLPGNPAASQYRRDWRTVTLDSGRQLEAWVYCYNQPADHLPVIPSGDYLDWARSQGWRPSAELATPLPRRRPARAHQSPAPLPAWAPLKPRSRRSPPGSAK